MPVVVVLLALLSSAVAVATPQTFRSAKKTISRIYQANLPLQSFYCGCDFKLKGKKLVPDLDSCGYDIRKQQQRAKRIEWEHVVPAYDFGRHRQCWQEGGRKNCRKDKVFKRMEADMHNLYPAIGEINGDRSNFRFSEWNGTPTKYGQCPMVIDFKRRQAQPPTAAKGQIARAYLYMSQRYNLNLASAQQKLYNSWHKLYPVDEVECRRHRLVSQQQGWPNPYTKQQCERLN